VEADDERVEAGPHRDAAHDGLGDDPCAHDEREHEEVAALHADSPHEHEEHEGKDADDARHHAVPELDQAVVAELIGRDERVGRAGRPGGASEARTGQPHGTARGDDERLRDEGEPRESADAPVDTLGQPLGEAIHARSILIRGAL
jgi:hypothetical protein